MAYEMVGLGSLSLSPEKSVAQQIVDSECKSRSGTAEFKATAVRIDKLRQPVAAD